MSGLFKKSTNTWGQKNKLSAGQSSNTIFRSGVIKTTPGNKLFGKGVINTTSKNKLFGACGCGEPTGFLRGLGAVVLILAILGVVIYLLSRMCGDSMKPKLKCKCTLDGIKPKKTKASSGGNGKETFIRNLTPIYASAGARGLRDNPLMSSQKDIAELQRTIPETKFTTESFDTPQYAEDLIDSKEQTEETPQYDVKKVSESGGKWTTDKTEGERARGKIVKSSPFSAGEMKQRKVIEDGEEDVHYPVPGISTGNPRLNNKTLGAIMIDDRGEGVNLGVSKPIETFGPAISTNSRLAGSSMNIAPITGACFKKYNTETFFENNSAAPPELNIMNGGPLTLKYDVNNTM